MEESQKKIDEKVGREKKKSTHTLHKRCYNNRIDNNNVVQRVGVDVVVVDFFTLVDERISNP